LLRHGHSDRIVIVGESPQTIQAGAERVFGVQQVLAAQGLAVACTIPTPWSPQSAFAAVGAYLAAGERPSALICLSDRIAMGAYQACRDAGVLVPNDISIISFDDSDLAAWLQPQTDQCRRPAFRDGPARRRDPAVRAAGARGPTGPDDAPRAGLDRRSGTAPAGRSDPGNGPNPGGRAWPLTRDVPRRRSCGRCRRPPDWSR
jgi:hypothetical protein